MLNSHKANADSDELNQILKIKLETFLIQLYISELKLFSTTLNFGHFKS